MKDMKGLADELVHLARSLREVAAAARAAGQEPLELTGAQVLFRVGEDGPVRLSVLAERMGLDLSTVSRQVPVLEQAGWLVRECDPRDRRASLVRLTEAGQREQARRRAAHARLLAEALPDWSDDEVARFVEQLGRLNRALDEHRTAMARCDRRATTPPATQEAV